MLPWHERLRLKQDFQQLRQQGVRLRQSFFSLVVLRENSQRRLAGFVVSKRISKKAVVRNRIKRQMRAAYAALRDSVENGCLLLFIAQPQIAEQGFQEIQRQIQQALHKAKVCHEC